MISKRPDVIQRRFVILRSDVQIVVDLRQAPIVRSLNARTRVGPGLWANQRCDCCCILGDFLSGVLNHIDLKRQKTKTTALLFIKPTTVQLPQTVWIEHAKTVFCLTPRGKVGVVSSPPYTSKTPVRLMLGHTIWIWLSVPIQKWTFSVSFLPHLKFKLPSCPSLLWVLVAYSDQVRFSDESPWLHNNQNKWNEMKYHLKVKTWSQYFKVYSTKQVGPILTSSSYWYAHFVYVHQSCHCRSAFYNGE